MKAPQPTVDEYIEAFPEGVRAVLETMRGTILAAAPGATEVISYGMPAVMLNGHPLIYFAGWKQHVSLYPLPPVDGPLELEVAPYRAAKATVKFRLDRPVPHDLIARIVGFLVEQQAASRPLDDPAP